ncbi:MAG: T9SS type A sorting domain-containing protein, partial [Bacteroidota bacterium]
SSDLQQILQVVHFPQGAVQDIRFMKTTSQPYKPTGDLFISGNTSDTYNNDGGYFLAKLDNNFVNGIPSALVWSRNVWASDYLKDYHPWDVNNKGEVYYISGEPFGYNWSAIYCLDQAGNRKVVNNWRTHWLKSGSEWHGTPASSYAGGIDSVNYSGIVLKIWGRCDLRSWTANDYNTYMSDGNGGTRKGKWPTDVLFNGPCDPNNPTHVSPGYTGYSETSCCPVHGGTCIVLDRRNNNLYIGMNFKSTASNGSPDFEPAVIAMDTSGMLNWWSRLYHEITPSGDTMESIPDQYIDALAIDYKNNSLVVGARCHGNNTENFWVGNTININSSAYGFQNQFTGTNGNIHETWLGKLRLADGVLTNSTYMAELFEGTGSLGTPHPDPNLDGWPDPNTGWPYVNTTKLTKNNMKISSDGSVCVMAVGRRTITTANAYQKMVKPYYGGVSCWNSFVRVYDENFHVPLFSSLVVGQWDTLTQAGGSNTDLYGMYKTNLGVVCVGRQTADTSGNANGNNIPVTNVTPWGTSTPQNESAILVYYQAANLHNSGDSISNNVNSVNSELSMLNEIEIYPNPTSEEFQLSGLSFQQQYNYSISSLEGKILLKGKINSSSRNISVKNLAAGIYLLNISEGENILIRKLSVIK